MGNGPDGGSGGAEPGASPTVDDVRRAARTIAGHAIRTPLLSSAVLDQRVGARVLLKAETLQRTGSFKFRGAYNRIAAIPPQERTRGVVARSSGNHAQGVAEAARLFGIPATVVMPSDAPAVKREGAERSGARIVPFDRDRDDKDAIAARIAAETGATFVHPYDDPLVIAGQGTVGLEIAEDCGRLGVAPDLVLVPASGGGLSAGIALAMADVFPEARVLVAEPDGYDDHRLSFEAGRIVEIVPPGPSAADALLAFRPGDVTFPINRRLAAGAVAATDAEAFAAVAFAARELKLVVEPGGAIGLAALLSGRVDVAGRTVVVVLSGGNLDPATLARIVSAA